MTDNQKLGLRIYYTSTIWRQGMPPFERLSDDQRKMWYNTLGFQMWFLGRQIDALKNMIKDDLKAFFNGEDRAARN